MLAWTPAQLAAALASAAATPAALAVLTQRLVGGAAQLVTAVTLLGGPPAFECNALLATCLAVPESGDGGAPDRAELAKWLIELPWPEVGARDAVRRALAADAGTGKRKRAAPKVGAKRGRGKAAVAAQSGSESISSDADVPPRKSPLKRQARAPRALSLIHI